MDVEYDPKFYRCGADSLGGPWKNISSELRGQFRPIYEIVYAHYGIIFSITIVILFIIHSFFRFVYGGSLTKIVLLFSNLQEFEYAQYSGSARESEA